MKILQADPEVLRNNRELTEQAGMWAVREIFGRSLECHLFIGVFAGGDLLLKVRGARLLREMVKPEDESEAEAESQE